MAFKAVEDTNTKVTSLETKQLETESETLAVLLEGGEFSGSREVVSIVSSWKRSSANGEGKEGTSSGSSSAGSCGCSAMAEKL
jgi:hypothetical protein